MDLDKIVQQLDNIELDDEMLPMKTGTSKSWIGQYHWVMPKMLKSVAMSKPLSDKDMIEWCEKQFGKGGSGHRWFEHHNRFYFKNEEDMTMFVLRWS